MRRSLLSFTTACGLCWMGACTFPDISIQANATGTSTSASGGSGGGATSTGGGAATGTGATAGSGNVGNDGGGGGTSMCNGGASGVGGGMGGVGGVDPCNKDGDPALAMAYPCCGGDCDDEDPNVFPTQTAFFDVPNRNGTFDYDCDGVLKRDPDQLFNMDGMVACTGALCVNGKGYDATAKCGTMDAEAFWSCTPVVCTKQLATPTELVRCR